MPTPRKPRKPKQLNWEAVTAAAKAMSGDPQFIIFLDAVHDLREAAVRLNQEEDVVQNHQAMTFNAAVTFTCDKLLDVAEPDQTV